MRLVAKFRRRLEKFVLRHLAFQRQIDAARMLVSDLARNEIFGKKVETGPKIPRRSRSVRRFRGFVPLFIASNIVRSGINEIFRNRRLTDLLIVEVNDRAGRFGRNGQPPPHAVASAQKRDRRRQNRRDRRRFPCRRDPHRRRAPFVRFNRFCRFDRSLLSASRRRSGRRREKQASDSNKIFAAAPDEKREKTRFWNERFRISTAVAPLSLAYSL